MKKILVVDDQESGHVILRDVIENTLGGVCKYISCEMMSAYSGREALEKIESNKPDMVMLDINMPQMDGFEVTRHIRQNEDTKDIYIVAVTAQAMSDDRSRCLRAGCNEYFSKPFDVLRLVHFIVDKLRG